MIDSALWTGRTGEWIFHWWYYAGGMGITLCWLERDALEGARIPVYGFQLGTHFALDGWGLTLLWNKTQWRWLRPHGRRYG